MPYSLRACELILVLMISSVSGCGQSGPPGVVPDLPDTGAAGKAMELYDTNHDGFLDAKELKTVPGLKAAVEQVDTNHDGKISEQEIVDRIKYWADSGIGRMPVVCRVTHNGKPLAGAKVVFAPEKFLGGNLKDGSGTTSAAGFASVSCPYKGDLTIKGLSPGFYRVEVTKDDEKIPTKYNSETTLGAEAGIGSVARFDLQY